MKLLFKYFLHYGAVSFSCDPSVDTDRPAEITRTNLDGWVLHTFRGKGLRESNTRVDGR